MEILEDELGGLTGDPFDNFLYTVELDDNGKHGFRYDDLEKLD